MAAWEESPVPVLILTRPIEASRRFLGEVEAALGRPVTYIVSPVMKVVPMAVDDLSEPLGGVVFSSENGVRQAGRLSLPPGMTAWCVGDRTAQVANAAGFRALSAQGDAEALIAMICAARPEGPLVHLHGEHTRGDVADRLTAAGVPCGSLAIYAQVPTPLTPEARAAFAGDKPVILPLFSPRSATILTGVGGVTAPLHVIAMSKAVANEASVLRLNTLVIADAPTGPAMVAATCRRIRAMPQE